MPDGNLPPIVIKPVSLHVSGNTLILRVEARSSTIRFVQAYLEQVTGSLPELPDDVRRRLPGQYGVSLADTEVLLSMDDINNTGVAYFEEVVRGVKGSEDVVTRQTGKQAVNWIVNELLGRLASKEETWTTSRVPAKVLGDLLRLISREELTGQLGGL